jgi:hypothetical protein
VYLKNKEEILTSSAKSKNQEKKEKFENRIFEMASPLLNKLYNTYARIPDQVDSPDAAILLSNPPRRFGVKASPVKIGIEITSVDPHWYLAYANDEKFGADLVNEEITRTVEHGIVADSPRKKVDVPIPKNFIVKGVIGKVEKYESYRQGSRFDEIILLCFSEVIGVKNKIFHDGLSAWTKYLLSQESFPFDKVIFVSPTDAHPEPIQLYDKKMKQIKPPPPYKYELATVTVIQSQTLLFSENYNSYEKFSGPPLIEPRSKFMK